MFVSLIVPYLISAVIVYSGVRLAIRNNFKVIKIGETDDDSSVKVKLNLYNVMHLIVHPVDYSNENVISSLCAQKAIKQFVGLSNKSCEQLVADAYTKASKQTQVAATSNVVTTSLVVKDVEYTFTFDTTTHTPEMVANTFCIERKEVLDVDTDTLQDNCVAPVAQALSDWLSGDTPKETEQPIVEQSDEVETETKTEIERETETETETEAVVAESEKNKENVDNN